MIHPSTGVIRTLRNFDVTIANNYELIVEAVDRASIMFGTGPKSSTASVAKVSVKIFQANRYDPIIEKIEPWEAGLPYRLKVTDKDKGIHAEIASLEIIDGDDENRVEIERIAGNSGGEFLLKPRTEMNEKINILLSAMDRGIPARNSTLNVQLDFSSASPRNPCSFKNSVYKFQINESVPLLTQVGFVKSNDIKSFSAFSRYGAPVMYAIVHQGADALPFAINSDTGLVFTTDSLNYDSNSNFYDFAVLCTEKSRAYLAANTTVQIEILNINTHPPEFDSDLKELEVSIDSALETGVGKVTAKDADGDEISYYLSKSIPAKVPFIVDAFTGEIKLRHRLDAKDPFDYILFIRAADWGRPLRRESEIVVRISVPELRAGNNRTLYETSKHPNNDHSPSFDETIYLLEVYENLTIGKSLARILAKDSDTGFNGFVQYSIVEGNEDSRWNIDTHNGDLFLVQPLNWLFAKEYRIKVNASDMGNPMRFSTAIVEIKVRNCNMRPPLFDRPIYVVRNVAENAIDSAILELNATDSDEGANGAVQYYLEDAKMNENFELDAFSGLLRVTQKLTKATYELKAVAMDLGLPSLSATVNILIIVKDVNEPPKCGEKLQTTAIPEDFLPNSVITCITAFDEDSEPQNSRLSYKIMSSERLPFDLDPSTGCLYLMQKLDYETQTSYRFRVGIADGGQPSLSVTCEMMIEVLDISENLNPPEFQQFAYQAKVRGKSNHIYFDVWRFSPSKFKAENFFCLNLQRA